MSLGVLAGLFGASLLAVAGLVVAVLVPGAVLLASVARLIRPSRSLEAGGMLLGTGGVLAFYALRVMTGCQDSSCGQPNALPLLGLAAVLLVAGAVTARVGLTRSAT